VRSTTKIRSKNNLYPHRHFTDHLMDVFERSLRESNLNYKILSFSICQLKNKTRMSSCNNPHIRGYKKNQSLKTQTELLGVGHCSSKKKPRRQTPPISASSNESSARVSSAGLKTSAEGCWRCASRQLRKRNRSTHEIKTAEDRTESCAEELKPTGWT
jgi:hypothetical protein